MIALWNAWKCAAGHTGETLQEKGRRMAKLPRASVCIRMLDSDVTLYTRIAIREDMSLSKVLSAVLNDASHCMTFGQLSRIAVEGEQKS